MASVRVVPALDVVEDLPTAVIEVGLLDPVADRIPAGPDFLARSLPPSSCLALFCLGSGGNQEGVFLRGRCATLGLLPRLFVRFRDRGRKDPYN